MTTTTKSGAGVSRYLRLYGVLSQALAEGRFGPGEPLPSEPRLMRNYAVSRSTVRRALARLEAEGRIERKRGSGTYARHEGRGEAARRELFPALDDMAAPPAGVSSRTIAFQHVSLPGFLVAEQPTFGGTPLLVRRVRSVGRQPVVLETAYLPPEVGAGLTRRQMSPGGAALLAVLAALGHRSSSLEREFAAVEADPLTADSLKLAVGAPLFNVRTVARDSRHRALAYLNCLYRADRYEAGAVIEIGDPVQHQHRVGARS